MTLPRPSPVDSTLAGRGAGLDAEASRLAELKAFCILDTPPDPAFDDLTALAAYVTGQPTALISLIDTHRQWFKSRVGLDVTELPRDDAFCAIAIRDYLPLLVPDATRDPRFVNNRLVTGPPYIRFYCGVPLVSSTGYALGTLCVIGYKPTSLDATAVDALQRLSRQVTAQLELRRSQAELVAARVAAEQAHAEARRHAHAKTSFLAMASHEMLTPLNAIVGLSDVLRDRLPDADDRAMCTEIHGSGRHLETLLSGMIDLSLLQSGSLMIASDTLTIAAEIESVFEELRPLAKPKALPLVSAAADGAPTELVGDSARLRQVITHLVDNAIKFTSTGSVTVRWRGDSLSDGTPAVRIDVADTGCGMRAADVARLMERFSQHVPGDPVVQPGLGLGLAITRLLVGAMGGTVSVDSRPGVGTTFTLVLPNRRANTPPYPAGQVPTASSAAGRPRVLVVDDNDVNRMLAVRLLARLGYDALVANDGAEALAIDPTHYDCVLMDCQMPVMDGLAATQAIRAREATAGGHTPVIAVSASLLSSERSRCFEAGMDEAVSKPLTAEVLRLLLDRHLPVRTADPRGAP